MMWYTVRFDTQTKQYILWEEGEDWDGSLTWLDYDEAVEERDYLNAREASRNTVNIPDENPADFSHSGLGIGGLATYEEPLTVPSTRVLEREQRLRDTDVICRRCGASKNFDGAMFTTGGGDICDDCF